jgi:hypothetical protein
VALNGADVKTGRGPHRRRPAAEIANELGIYDSTFGNWAA